MVQTVTACRSGSRPALTLLAATVVLWVSGCSAANPQKISLDNALVPTTVEVAAGRYIAGSDQAEREYAYQLDQKAYGHNRTRTSGWYDRERPRQTVKLEAFEVTQTPITNAQYAAFVQSTAHPAPNVDEALWKSYGLIHPWSRTRKFAWIDGAYGSGRDQHPVVLVSFDDARAYARWLSGQTRQDWSLPSEDQWEKAVRGTRGWRFPWGDQFDPELLNSHDAGPFDTVAVAGFVKGASEFGVLDGAGQVFEWTSTQSENGRVMVKGGSWDDSGCGVCRPAASHFRPAALRHILIGFRLVRSPASGRPVK